VGTNRLKAQTIIDLKFEAPPLIPSMVAVKILENAIIYRMGSRQYIDYFGAALTIWDEDQDQVTIYSQNESRLFELGFLAVHSLLGQNLDRRGLSRIHALAFTLQNTNAVIMLPSKGGKSTLLTGILENPEVKIISDDMPLCDSSGRIHSFPSKISLQEIPTSGPLSELTWHEFVRHHYPPKFTASLSQLKDRLSVNSEKNSNILIAGFRLSHGESFLSKVPKWKMILPLMEHMIMGFGLPQILEMFLKFNLSDIFKLCDLGLKRAVCAFQLARRAQCYYFYLGPDKSKNSKILLDFVNEHKHS
jgi:hypothetical protein